MSMQKGVAELAAKQAADPSKVRSAGTDDKAWADIQTKTFLKWTNSKLETVGASIKDLEKDFDTGVNLIKLLEVCSGKTMGKYNKNPSMKPHCLENLTNAIKFAEKDGLTFVNIGPGDIYDGNSKLILGLLWTIIYNYQVLVNLKAAAASQPKGAPKVNAKDLLLEWVNSVLPAWAKPVTNFSSDWNSGRVLCALCNAVGGKPDLIPNAEQMNPDDGVANNGEGVTKARDALGIPRLLEGEDLANPNVDDKSVMMYVSYFKDAKRVGDKPAAAAERTPTRVFQPQPQAEPAPAPEPTPAPAPKKEEKKEQPPPWERAPTWREYKGEDLGGRCKIRVYYSTTTHDQKIRSNFKALQDLLERENVHKRPDFEFWIPIDVDMTKELRDKIFAKAGTRVTPMLFIDDEYVGDFAKVMEMNESGDLHKLLKY